MTPLYQHIARSIEAIVAVQDNEDIPGMRAIALLWFHEDRLESWLKLLPSGSGFDSSASISSHKDNSFTLTVPYHPMNEHGFYEDWVEANVRVEDSLAHGISIETSGVDELLGEYIEEQVYNALNEEYESNFIQANLEDYVNSPQF